MKSHYLKKPDEDELSAIIENGYGVNQNVLLAQRKKVIVAIRKKINALSRLPAEYKHQQPNSDNQALWDLQQLHQRLHQHLSCDQQVQHHILKGSAEVSAQSTDLFMQDYENTVEILQAINNNDDPINIAKVMFESSDGDEMDLTSEVTVPS